MRRWAAILDVKSPSEGGLDPSRVRPTVTMRSRFWLAAVVAVLAALYCFSGYAMNASLGGGSPDEARYVRYAEYWGIASLVFLLVAGGFSVAAWRAKRGSPRPIRGE